MGGVGLVGKWVEATGTSPETEDSGEVPGHRGLTWADVYESRRRCGGPHHSLVNSWVASNLHTWVSRYVRAHGSAPARDSGSIPNSGGLTWADVDDSIRHKRDVIYSLGQPYYVPYDLVTAISQYEVVKEINRLKKLKKGVADGQ